jgi:hypothetical protein
MRVGEFVMNRQPDVNWNGYLRDIPLELADSIRGYVTHCSRSLREENRINRLAACYQDYLHIPALCI